MTSQTLSVGPEPEIEIERVGGDLVVEGWDRNEIAVTGDDLDNIEQDGQSVNMSCGGDLKLSVPRGAKLTVDFVGGDAKIENLNGAVETAFIGGDALLKNLAGQVTLSGMIGGDTQMENVNKVNVEAGKAGLHADLSDRIRRQVEAATRKAERKIQEAQRKAHHAEFRLQRNKGLRAHVDMGRWNVTPGSFTPGGISGEPVSDEERMTILKMLQEKKITAEEAEKLLAALEGGE